MVVVPPALVLLRLLKILRIYYSTVQLGEDVVGRRRRWGSSSWWGCHAEECFRVADELVDVTFACGDELIYTIYTSILIL